MQKIYLSIEDVSRLKDQINVSSNTTCLIITEGEKKAIDLQEMSPILTLAQ